MCDDEAALVRAAQTDPQAFGELYARHVDQIYAFAVHLTADPALAEDLTAAAFEQALRALPAYEWRGQPFANWLYQIARREVYAHWRRQRRWFDWLRRGAGPAVSPAGPVFEERIALAATLARCLNALPPAYREVLVLRYLQDLPSQQVAAILDCSVNDVYRRVNRALKRMRALLPAEEGGLTYVAE